MHLTIFDLDRTILKINISFKYYLYLYKKTLVARKIEFYVFKESVVLEKTADLVQPTASLL